MEINRNIIKRFERIQEVKGTKESLRWFLMTVAEKLLEQKDEYVDIIYNKKQ